MFCVESAFPPKIRDRLSACLVLTADRLSCCQLFIRLENCLWRRSSVGGFDAIVVFGVVAVLEVVGVVFGVEDVVVVVEIVVGVVCVLA